MREIQASTITDVIERLCIEANNHLPEDVKCAIKNCRACESWDIAQGVLIKLLKIMRSQMSRMCRSVRIQEWPVYSLRLDRMYILWAEI